MSLRTDAMDLRSAVESLINQMAEAEYGYGDRQPDAEVALGLLLRQVEEASRSVEAAWLRHQIDLAEHAKQRVEERLVELGKVPGCAGRAAT